MRPIRLLRTANFRLAAVYALIFGVSVAILAAVVYFRSTSALEDQARLRVPVHNVGRRESRRAPFAPSLRSSENSRKLAPNLLIKLCSDDLANARGTS